MCSLQHRLADIIGRLAVPSPEDNVEQLDQEFKDLTEQIRRLHERTR